MSDQFSQDFELFWIFYFIMEFFIMFITILFYDPHSRVDVDTKTYLRWFIAWPVLVPLWTLFWTFVLFEWLLSEKEPFESRLFFLLEDKPTQQKQKKNQ
jgi:hypothetical protein